MMGHQSKRDDMLDRISRFRPSEAIFEIGQRKNKSSGFNRHRKPHELNKTENNEELLDGLQEDSQLSKDDSVLAEEQVVDQIDFQQQWSNSDEEAQKFDLVEHNQARKKRDWQDPEIFMTYLPQTSDYRDEQAYGVHSGSNKESGRNEEFLEAAQSAVIDLQDDESKGFGEPRHTQRMQWDKKSKKYVNKAANDQQGKSRKYIRGESGQKIASSFRSGRYDAWRKARKFDVRSRDEVTSSKSVRDTKEAHQKYRHHQVRGPKEADKYRDNFFKQKKKLEAAKQNLSSESIKHAPKKELRGIDEIRKQRAQKLKRREKSNRPLRRK